MNWGLFGELLWIMTMVLWMILVGVYSRHATRNLCRPESMVHLLMIGCFVIGLMSISHHLIQKHQLAAVQLQLLRLQHQTQEIKDIFQR